MSHLTHEQTLAELTPKSIVTSLEWSKKLKEAGWPTDYEAAFFWAIHGDKANVIPASFLPMSATSDGEYIAAPTAEEILRRLPIKLEISIGGLECGHSDENEWWISYNFSTSLNRMVTTKGDSLATAAAAMYCYLSSHSLLHDKA